MLTRLGAGGMGEVWEALDTTLDRRVAVKLIRSEYASEDMRMRLQREAQALARIAHPNIVAVYDVGMDHEHPYLVMELLEGVDLRHLLTERGPLQPDTAREVAAGMCAGLAAAHEVGVLHRDVKPGNVHLTRTGRVVLQDFGIAHLLDTRGLTVTGTVIGTPGYMAPEVLRGETVGPAADMYGLGTCLHEMLSGRPAFEPSAGVAALMYQVVYEQPDPLPGGMGIPADLAELVHRLLSKEPADRPAPSEVIRELARPAGADQLIARAVTGELRDRALGRFTPGTLGPRSDTEVVPQDILTPEPPTNGADVRPADVTGAGHQADVTLSSLTRAHILRAMSPEAAEAKQREAVNLVLRGSLEEAVDLLSGVAEVWRSAYPPDHPSALTCAYWQAVCLARLGAGPEALAKFGAVATGVQQAPTPHGRG
ncbi:serine/threonine-protein kinase [Streptomyces sp. NPDC050848]|uniref:serine/threonine-protein kinase n=1 Tax=Streptomyces sp. NPDC050848 TaxID=3155791 RepID=UPI00340DE979